MRHLSIVAFVALLLLAESVGHADSPSQKPAPEAVAPTNADACKVDPSDAECKLPLDLSVAETWLAAIRARLEVAQKAMDDEETALKLAQTKEVKPDPATDRSAFENAQREFLAWRHTMVRAELDVASLEVNLGKLRMWERRFSVGVFGGVAAGNASQLGVWFGHGWTISPNVEAEIAYELRHLYGPDSAGAAKSTLLPLSVRFRSLIGAKSPVHVGTTFSVRPRDGGAGFYLMPEIGAMLRLRNRNVCAAGTIWPWGIGISIEPVIPLKNESGPVMVMFNLTAELGVGWGRLLGLDTFDSWYGDKAREALGCDAAAPEPDQRGTSRGK
jgi:hypothetical protein